MLGDPFDWHEFLPKAIEEFFFFILNAIITVVCSCSAVGWGGGVVCVVGGDLLAAPGVVAAAVCGQSLKFPPSGNKDVVSNVGADQEIGDLSKYQKYQYLSISPSLHIQPISEVIFLPWIDIRVSCVYLSLWVEKGFMLIKLKEGMSSYKITMQIFLFPTRPYVEAAFQADALP